MVVGAAVVGFGVDIDEGIIVVAVSGAAVDAET